MLIYIILIYLVGLWLTGLVYSNLNACNEDNIAFIVFWPITVPIWAGYWIAVGIFKLSILIFGLFVNLVDTIGSLVTTGRP